jgi:hypothetical protein
MSDSPPGAPSVLQRDVHPWLELHRLAPHLFTPGRLKHLLRQRDRNGLASHLRWIGRVAVIREADLASWLAEQKKSRRGRS